MTQRSVAALLAAAALLALAIPPLVFAACALAAGLGPGATFAALLEQYTVARSNLLLCGLAGWLPLLLLAIVAAVIRRRQPARAWPLTAGGAAGILLILVWVNLQFWPVFLPERVYPGFPHGLEFVIGPIFFAPVAMLAGMLLAHFLVPPADGA